MQRVYLDHASTTPIYPEAAEAMSAHMKENFGNPSNTHYFGQQASVALDEAARSIGEAIGTETENLIFTSGGTESDNMAVIGTALQRQKEGNHIITSTTEHFAVLRSCEAIQSMADFDVTYLKPDSCGRISATQVAEALRDDTILISIMYGNNEVGTLQPVHEIGVLADEHDIVFHTDAVQALGTVDLDVDELSADLVSFSAHKVGGPKGVGCLYARTKFTPLLHGGKQQNSRRPGTENVAGVIGFAEALKSSKGSLRQRRNNYRNLKNAMLQIFRNSDVTCQLNGHETQTLPHILNVSFEQIRADILLANLDLEGIAASSGSACTAGTFEPSHVISSMHTKKRAKSAIRFSFGRKNSLEQVKWAAEKVIEVIKRIRSTGR